MARSATIEPMLPQPIRPSVLPLISTPMKRFFSHLPAWVESIGRGKLAGDREHHGDGVLGGRDRIAERRVHHDDALGGRRRDVDIVDADAGAADDAELLGGGEHLVAHLGGGADGEAVIVADHGEQLLLVLAEIGLVVDLDAAILEDLRRRSWKACRKRGRGGLMGWSFLDGWLSPAPCGTAARGSAGEGSVRRRTRLAPHPARPSAATSPMGRVGDCVRRLA